MILAFSALTAERTPIVRDVPVAALDVSPDDFTVEGLAHFDGEVVRLGDEMYQLRGRLQARLSLPCSRCLEPYELPMDAQVDLKFAPAPSPGAQLDDEREISDEDPSLVTYDEPQIDLAQVIREQAYLALPMKPLCREDCQGLCPQCGINRNVATCTCEHQWVDPRLAGLKSLLKDAEPG